MEKYALSMKSNQKLMENEDYEMKTEKNIENKNKIPTKIAVRPVLPPASTPAELST